MHGFPADAARTRAIEALDAVGLADGSFRDRLPGRLSGGERQRVGLARAIVLRPELLVADEPTSMLDASRQVEFLELVRDLRAWSSVALLHITHDLALAAATCDRIVVLDAGRVVEEGSVAGIISRPREAVTISLVVAARARALAISGGSGGADHAADCGAPDAGRV